MKQTGIYLILGGAVVFILVFIGKIMALVFNNPLLGLALMAVVIGVFIGIGLQNLFGVTWVLWIGVFIGIGAAGLNIYKIYQKQKKELDKLKDDPRYKNYAQQKDDDEDDY